MPRVSRPIPRQPTTAEIESATGSVIVCPTVSQIAAIAGASGGGGQRTWGLTYQTTTATYVSGVAPPTAASLSVTWAGTVAAAGFGNGPSMSGKQCTAMARTGTSAAVGWPVGFYSGIFGKHYVAAGAYDSGSGVGGQIAMTNTLTGTFLGSGGLTGIGYVYSNNIFGDHYWRAVRANGGAIQTLSVTAIASNSGGGGNYNLCVCFDFQEMTVGIVDVFTLEYVDGPHEFTATTLLTDYVNVRNNASAGAGANIVLAPAFTFGLAQ